MRAGTAALPMGGWCGVLLAAGILCSAGCAELGGLDPRVPLGLSPDTGMTQQELHTELAEFSARFVSMLGAMGDRIQAEGAPPAVVRRALVLRVQLAPVVQQHALEPDPRHGYVALLSLAVLLRRYVDGEGGRLDFEGQEAIVRNTVVRLEDDLVRLGARFLPPPRLEELRTQIEAFAREQQPGGGFAVLRAEDSLADLETRSALMSLVELPLLPIRALGGVEEGPAAIREFTQTSRGIAAILATLPLQLRWQVDLLVEDTLSEERLAVALDELEALAGSAERISAAAERLPETFALRLREVEGPLRELDETLETARSLLDPLGRTAQEVARAGRAWGRIVDGDERKAAGTAQDQANEDGAPDLESWRSTASEVGRSAERIRRAADAIARLAGERRKGDATTPVDVLDRRMRDLVDFVFWRLALLGVVFLALCLAYRFASSRLARS